MVWEMSSWARSRQNSTSTCTSNKAVLRAGVPTAHPGLEGPSAGKVSFQSTIHTQVLGGEMRAQTSVLSRASGQQPTWSEPSELGVDNHHGRAASH